MKKLKFARMKFRNRKGMVLSVVIFALVIFAVVAVAALQTSSDSLKSGRAFREAALALYAAESGMRYTTANWPSSADSLSPGDSVNLGWRSLGNRATYRAVITRVDGGGLKYYLMVVDGRGVGNKAYTGQRTVVRSFGQSPIFKWGIFTHNGVTMSGGSITDSFDSSVGTYTTATAGTDGDVATNGSISMSGGGTQIRGDAAAVGTITAGYTLGTATPRASVFPTLPTISCPSTSYPSTIPASDNGKGSVSYNSGTGVLSISGGGNVTLTGSSYYFSQVTLSGGSTLTFTSSVHIDVTVAGKLDVSGGGIFNTSGIPTRLGIWACGNPSNPQGWVLSGGSGASYSVYAPDRAVSVTGSGDIYGALVGKTYTATGGSKFHYDINLANTLGNQLAVIPGSWTELTLY